VAALDDVRFFNRPLRVPSLSADHAAYSADGGYWLGGVWPPTTYMVLRGLTHVGYDDVAADVGANYHHNVVRCYQTTGTIWENMAPEFQRGWDDTTRKEVAMPVPGEPAKGDFVGACRSGLDGSSRAGPTLAHSRLALRRRLGRHRSRLLSV
jgi:hypothetical protein